MRDPSEHLTTLSRMLQQVDLDERYTTRRRRRLKVKITELMREFQLEVSGQHDEVAS